MSQPIAPLAPAGASPSEFTDPTQVPGGWGPAGPPPRVSQWGAIGVTAGLLGLWLGLTLGAERLDPMLQAAVDHLQFAWGLDVSRGERE